MIKVGILADINASPSYRTKEVFMTLYNTFGPTLKFFSTGSTEIERHFQKLALEKNCHYGEFNLASTCRNSFSMLSESYYNKRSHPTHEIDAHIRLFRHVDRVIIFNAGNLKLENFFKMAQRANKKIVIIDL